MVNAGFVGVGVSQPAVVVDGVVTQVFNGDTGHLILNNSAINTTTFEIGALSTLSGDGGTINASGDVIVGGTISPGNSPGRIHINCNIITLPGSKLILAVADIGGSYAFDELIIGTELVRASTFDLAHMQIEFHFLGDTNPLAAAAALGGLDLDNFLRVGGTGDETTGLSTLFAGKTWTDVVDMTQITARFERLHGHGTEAAKRRQLHHCVPTGSRAVDLGDGVAGPPGGGRRR